MSTCLLGEKIDFNIHKFTVNTYINLITNLSFLILLAANRNEKF